MANERGKDLNEDPITGEPGSHPVGTGLGAAGGAAAGAALGTAVGGPIGTVVGGIIGAVTGGLAGKDVAENLARIFHRSRATNEYGIALVCPKIQVSNLDQRAGNAEAKLYRRN